MLTMANSNSCIQFELQHIRMKNQDIGQLFAQNIHTHASGRVENEIGSIKMGAVGWEK